MNEEKPPEIKIYAPDRSLQTKIGVTNLETVLTPQIVESAQKTIQQTADQFFEEVLSDLQRIEQAWEKAQKGPLYAGPHITVMTDTSFSIKSKSPLAGYELVGTLAKSLQGYCEKIGDTPLSGRNIEIIQWHIDSIARLLTAKIKGMGGAVGEAIQAEIKRLGGLDNA